MMESALGEMSVRAYGREQLSKIASIIAYEAGEIIRDTIRMEDYPHITALYKSLAKVSLGDVLAMAQLFCDMAEFDFNEVYNQGVERAIQRCREKLEGRDGF